MDPLLHLRIVIPDQVWNDTKKYRYHIKLAMTKMLCHSSESWNPINHKEGRLKLHLKLESRSSLE